MDFFKKHYEKITLLVLFVIFALLLVHLLDIIQSTGEVTEKDLQIPTRDADYRPANSQDAQFDLTARFLNRAVWNKSVARRADNKEHFSDLMVMFQAARCGHCEKIIPLYYFGNNRKCLLCNEELLEAKKPDINKGGNSNLQDTDQDGIPDISEVEFGLNPYDGNDAMEDLDGDGFVNLYEYIEKTDLRNSQKHPPLYVALSVERLERIPLKVVLKGVTVTGTDEKNWDVQLFTEKMRQGKIEVQERNNIKMLNEKIKVDNVDYRLTKINLKLTDITVDGKPAKKDESSVILTDPRGRQILLEMDQTAYDPDDKAVLKYLFDDEERKVGSNESFQLGDKKIGVSKYLVKAIDKLKKTVTIVNADDKTAQEITIDSEPKMPKDFRPRPKQSEQMGPDGMMPGMGPGGIMAPGARPQRPVTLPRNPNINRN